jgi:pteridine reductase
VALVTGAGVRLGRELALGLGRAGCDVVLHCHRSVKEAEATRRELEALGRRAAVLRADLSRPDRAAALARAAERVFGRIDILVNSAAVFWPTEPEALTLQELDAFLAVNLRSPYVLAAELGRAMQRRGAGAILNLACVSGLRPWKQFLPYSISKAGVVSLTAGLAKVLGPQVRVNAIAPGTVLPPEHYSARKLKELAARVPLQRTGCAADVVDAALYVLRAPFVTGQVLCVDGGRAVV